VSRRIETAVLISGRGSNMLALIEASRPASFPARVSVVISDRPEAAGLKLAVNAGVEALAIDAKAAGSRAAFEAELDAALRVRGVELICLAGFMRILSADFVARWQGRALNIHPSLLPAYRGLDTHARALADGVPEHGCTVHWVTAELDAGEIVAQTRVPVLSGDTPETLAARVLAEEHRLYPAALAEATRRHLVTSGASTPLSSCVEKSLRGE
jgi:phosphoribosylglycinamide formyltransferase-1